MSDHFGILGIKGLRIFQKKKKKKFMELLLFFTNSTFELTSFSIHVMYVQLFFNCQTIIFTISKTQKK